VEVILRIHIENWGVRDSTTSHIRYLDLLNIFKVELSSLSKERATAEHFDIEE
jgi:hypothetical protein